MRKAVVDSGLTLKAFCRRHGICENTMGQHMRGDMRISPYMLRQYERKLGIPRKELEDAQAEYDEKSAEAQHEIDDAQKELDDLRAVHPAAHRLRQQPGMGGEARHP